MSADLLALFLLCPLAFALQLLPGLGRFSQPGGLAWGISNRDAPVETPAWAARAQRAHANLMENLPHYAIVVLVTATTQHTNALTAMAGWVFLGARVAHAIVYIAGVTYVRTVAFYVGVAAEIAIASQLFV